MSARISQQTGFAAPKSQGFSKLRVTTRQQGVWRTLQGDGLGLRGDTSSSLHEKNAKPACSDEDVVISLTM
jgi:hypothetical protein